MTIPDMSWPRPTDPANRLSKDAPILVVRHRSIGASIHRGWVDFEDGSTIGYLAGERRGMTGSLRYDDEGIEWARGHNTKARGALLAARALSGVR